MSEQVQTAKFHVETDNDGFTFVHGDELPYWVVEDLEMLQFDVDLPQPEAGEYVGPFEVEWNAEKEIVTHIET